MAKKYKGAKTVGNAKKTRSGVDLAAPAYEVLSIDFQRNFVKIGMFASIDALDSGYDPIEYRVIRMPEDNDLTDLLAAANERCAELIKDVLDAVPEAE